MKKYLGKVAAITGGASGIGRSLALRLAAQGCHLALSDVNVTGLQQTVALLNAQAAATGKVVRITTQQLDVADRAAMLAWADRVVAEHGQVNFIFNNAGVALGANVSNVSPADFEWIMGINFWGVVWGTQAFLPHLRRAGQGQVVNLSSVFGLLSLPTQGTYNASKFAVRGFTEALRQELDLERCGVSATCVHPGGIRTNIARDARLYENLGGANGVDSATARERFDKLLNMTSADAAAAKILRAVAGNRRRVLIGPDAMFLDVMVRVLGSWYQPLMTSLTRMNMAR